MRSDIKTDINNCKIIRCRTAVVGTGAAGYNAATELHANGVDDVIIVTEGINMGTSRNTGSDKQTYYKLSLSGNTGDSPAFMAEDLFSTGCMDGDNALCEAAGSAQAFLKLCGLGVPFPVNSYGEHIGYKTDHDPKMRATSVGPLTSKVMTEVLQGESEKRGIRTLDNLLVVDIIKGDEGVIGLLALDKSSNEFVLIDCANVVFATGGPACIYEDSVYPTSHTGATGVLVESGADMQNLTEWQYGLASTAPRWNVSGTYMQVLPRFVSVDKNGIERYFVEAFFDKSKALSMTFLKGYEWPFDSRKILKGSSIIDLLVYRESIIGNRKVYLDYRTNPYGEGYDFHALNDDAKAYLLNAEANFGSPIDRLIHMNLPAYELYLNKGIDLKSERLEIALCAQHHNGGVAVDKWWQSSVSGLYVAGEAAGTHGVYRPGGSALNSGQVGSSRAARHIAHKGRENADKLLFDEIAVRYLDKHTRLVKEVTSHDSSNIADWYRACKVKMSQCAGAVRLPDEINQEYARSIELIKSFTQKIKGKGTDSLTSMYKLRDMLFARTAVLAALADYAKHSHTRGSALVADGEGAYPEGLGEKFSFRLDGSKHLDVVQTVRFDGTGFCTSKRSIRPLPQSGGFFENVWRSYRENGNID